MKRLTLAAFALLVIAGTVAYAQSVVRDGQSFRTQLSAAPVAGIVRADSTAKLLTTDASGNLGVVSTNANRDNWRLYSSIISGQLGASTAGGNKMMDSSAVLDTHDMKQMALVLYGTMDSLSTVVRVAVQVRAHVSTQPDSASAFPWYRWPVRSTTVASDVDSVGHFTYGTSAVGQSIGSTGTVWSGEFIVKFDVARQDSTGSGNGKFGAFPKGMYLPLTGREGAPFWAPYTSVRIRVLNGVRSRLAIRADLVGTSL